jgi:Cu-Zn family superoxide dismutase
MKHACIALAAAFAASAAGGAQTDYKVDMNSIDIKGVGPSLGTVIVTAAPQGGVVFTPNLAGLPPGEHGFHVHEFANCGAKEKDGKLTAGEDAGGHWDPQKTHKHAGPTGGGHKGDLPALKVAADGTAKQAVTAPGIKFADLKSKSLIIHVGGDNYSDQPKPNGGGGDRIVCGIIQSGER